MKSGKLSMRSSKSERSFKYVAEEVMENIVMELDDYLTMACRKFQCPYPVAVRKDYRCDDFLQLKDEPAVKYKKITMAPATKDILKVDLNRGYDQISSRTVTSVQEDDDTLPITATYDNTNNLVEITLKNLKTIPRVLIQLICVIIPYYEQLTKLSIQQTCLEPGTIHEINKILPVSTITDLCFDGSLLGEANYAILLESHSSLSNLSLSRCKINDEVCKQIALKLNFSMPAERFLMTLNLSSNHITNEGAKHISEALRSNRHLLYLNLADNYIDDVGAAYVLDILKDFPMTSDEIMSMRRRYVEYLKVKQDVYTKYLNELNTSSIDKSVKKKKLSATSLKSKSQADKKQKEKEKNKTITTDDSLPVKAKIFAEEVMGSFNDPFNSENTKIQDTQTYCNGNMVLCYLNLSYNKLSLLSVNKLEDILIYQNSRKKSNQTGLLKAMIEGNAISNKCAEMNTIYNLLAKSIDAKVKFDNSSKRQRRQTNISVSDKDMDSKV